MTVDTNSVVDSVYTKQNISNLVLFPVAVLRKTRSMTKSEEDPHHKAQPMDSDDSGPQPKHCMANGELVTVRDGTYTIKRTGNNYYCT